MKRDFLSPINLRFSLSLELLKAVLTTKSWDFLCLLFAVESEKQIRNLNENKKKQEIALLMILFSKSMSIEESFLLKY